MAEEQIKITVGADTSQLNAELTKAQNNLKLFQAALAKSTNVKEIEYLQRSISGLEKQIGSLSGQMSGRLSSASGQATTTLTNLNRVVSDAPYGFIGIANNINPLVESFGRLKAETGSIGGALNALVSSLSGPGGLGIAFAAITSAITFAQMGFSAWTRGSKEAGNNTDDFKGRLAELTKELNYTTQALDDFVAKADTASKINDINIQARFSDKTEQGVLTRQSKFITISEELVKATEQRGKAYENFTNISRAAFKSEDEYNQASEAALKIYNDLIKKENDLIDARQEQAAANRLATIEDQRAADEAAKAAAKKIKAAEDAKDSIKKTLAKLREDLKDQVNIEIAFPNESTLSERINLIKGTITKLISQFNVDPKNQMIIDLKLEMAQLQMQLRRENVEVVALIKPSEDNKNIPDFAKKLRESSSFKSVQTFFENANKTALEQGAALNNILQSTATDIAINFGETLGAALAGTASIGDFFTGLLAQVGKGMQAFGKAMIQFAIKVEAIKKWAIANPALAIAGGIALIALGALLASQTKKKAFAVGTNYAPGGMALVGERGPEMVSLPRGARVTPAAQTAQMIGGAMQQVEVFGVLRGQDIYFSNKKYSQTYRRTT